MIAPVELLILKSVPSVLLSDTMLYCMAKPESPVACTVPTAVVFSSTFAVVLMFELVNSGIEAVVDRIGTQRHELSGRAKDVGSAAVLIALVNAAVVWLLVLTDFF